MIFMMACYKYLILTSLNFTLFVQIHRNIKCSTCKNSHLKRATREYNTYIKYARTYNYYYFPPGSRPVHAHIKGGWPGPDTIHNGGHIQKKNSQARMPEPFACAIARLRRITISYTSQHMLMTRGIYSCTVLCVRTVAVRSLWLDTVAYLIWSGALSRTRRHFQTRVRFRHALLVSPQSANSSASLSCIL